MLTDNHWKLSNHNNEPKSIVSFAVLGVLFTCVTICESQDMDTVLRAALIISAIILIITLILEYFFGRSFHRMP